MAAVLILAGALILAAALILAEVLICAERLICVLNTKANAIGDSSESALAQVYAAT
ncbi:MAG TPA: hypothetical protein VKD03_00225 [Burkholderiales bacterium]|nr:hypothetical protein [Burkholderiales bacterium]